MVHVVLFSHVIVKIEDSIRSGTQDSSHECDTAFGSTGYSPCTQICQRERLPQCLKHLLS